MEITGEDIGYEGQSCEGRPTKDYVEKNEREAEGAGELCDGRRTPLMTICAEEIEKKEEAARRMGCGKTMKAMSALEALDVMSGHLTVNKAQLFPTKRRPEKRKMSDVPQAVCDQWVKDKGISIYEGLAPEEREAANRLVYTWKDVFESDLLKIRTTDLIEPGIDLKPGAQPERAKRPLYTEAELRFANKLIPQMEQAGLILRCDSIWVARTKFPPKPNRPANQEGNLRMVHNCCFIAVAHSQKRGGRKWGGQIGVTGGKGDRNEMAGIAGG